MHEGKFPDEVLVLFKRITNKRAKIVIDHILEHGSITTEDLEKKYGYNHPPRAARDVREAGIPLITFRVKSSDGRSIAAYKFDDLTKINKKKLKGRIQIPKYFKNDLLKRHDNECRICCYKFDGRYLQVDHKIPYEIIGETLEVEWKSDDYMLLCSSCNRAKSWSCEHCENWKTIKDLKLCKTCYWGSPEDYSHIALKNVRRIDLIWDEKEISEHEYFKKKAEQDHIQLSAYIKKLLREIYIRNKE